MYSRRQDAMAAVKRYNNVQLDGKPMKIEIVGINLVAPVVSLPMANNPVGNMNGYPRRYSISYNLMFECHLTLYGVLKSWIDFCLLLLYGFVEEDRMFHLVLLDY